MNRILTDSCFYLHSVASILVSAPSILKKRTLTSYSALHKLVRAQQQVLTPPQPSAYILRHLHNRSPIDMDQKLTKDETARYSRQMLCPEIGKRGQLRLKSSSVLIVGAGGLGCPSSLYLTAAGIGRLGIIDNDVVDLR